MRLSPISSFRQYQRIEHGGVHSAAAVVPSCFSKKVNKTRGINCAIGPLIRASQVEMIKTTAGVIVK